MKYLPVLLLLLLLTACNKQKIADLEEQNKQLTEQNVQLSEESSLKDEFIEDYTQTLNDVYDNLENIRKREGLLTKYSRDLEKNKNISVRDKMLSNIASIDTYIKKSRKEIKQLESRVANYNMKIRPLKETIENLNRVLQEKEVYITQLKAEVDLLSSKIVKAEKEIRQKDELIEKTSRMLNTAYYIIGSKKELKEKGIIEEKGGFLGIRKTKKLSNNFDSSYFTSTDISETTVIPINENINKVKLISPHNPESYHLVKESDGQTNLEIINPEEFWKIKYLVILTKG